MFARTLKIGRFGALVAMLLFVAEDAAARGFGGGFRGGGSMSMGRGGGGFSHGGSFGHSGGGTFSRGGNYSKPSAATRPGAGGGGQQISGRDVPATRPGGGGSGTQWNPNNRPGGGGSGTELRPGNRPNNDCPGCGGSGTEGWIDHPVAAGVVIGAVAGAATAAAIGSSYYALPTDCLPYYWSDLTYYSCGGVWYQPQYEGDTIVYVTVPDPSGGQQKPAQ